MGVKKQFERGDESLSSTSLMASTQSIKASRGRKQRCRRMLEARFKVCTEHSSNCAKGAIRKDWLPLLVPKHSNPGLSLASVFISNAFES